MEFNHTVDLFKNSPELVEHFSDPVIAMDASLRITFWNYGASEVFGYSPQEVDGKKFQEVLPSVMAGEATFDLRFALPLPWRGDLTLRSKAGGIVHGKCLLTGVSDTNGLVLVMRNVSEQKTLEHLVHDLKLELADRKNKTTEELARLYEQINEGFIAFDEDWNYTHMNRKAAEMVGRDPKDLIGKNVWKEFPKTKQSNFYSAYMEAMRTQCYRRLEEYSAELDRWFEVDVFPSPKGLSILFHDVTELKRTSKLLSQREMLYRNIVETAQEGIWTTNEGNKTNFVNNAVAKMLGYERQEIIGRRPEDFMDKDDAGQAWNNQSLADAKAGVFFECRLVTKTGARICVSVHATPLYADGAYCGALAMMTDITERKNKEMELKSSFEQLREYAGRLQHVREEERSAIAREIHDVLGQQLTALKMDAYWLSKNANITDTKAVERINRITEAASMVLNIVEKKVVELHPGLLHSLGLLAAIEWQNSEFEERFQIDVFFEPVGNDAGFSQQLNIGLYRIYQEALTNIAKHAKATSVAAKFYRDDQVVSMEISDNGSGFNIDILRTKRSLGILGMQERATMMGGDFFIESNIGKGTRLCVRIPIQNSNFKQ